MITDHTVALDANTAATIGALEGDRDLDLTNTALTGVALTVGGNNATTTSIDLQVTLPANADLPASRAVYSAANPYAFDRLDPNSYNHSTQTVVYDSAGNSFPATVYYTRTADVPTSTWEARLFVGAEEATPSPVSMTFDAGGNRTAPIGAVAFGGVFPSGAAAPITLSLDLGTTNQASGPFTLLASQQNGASAGTLSDVSIGEDGLVTATFSNGETQSIAKLAMANFSNPAGLKQRGDANWSITGASGQPTIGEPGQDGLGRVQSGALERANVDITEELVALISAQRNFQANAKAIETGSTMTQAIINMRS